MAKISTYDIDTNITGFDIVVGSDGEQNGATKNFRVDTLKNYINNNSDFITDAPDDGSQYARKNEQWSKITNYSEFDPTTGDNVAGGFPVGSDWFNTITGEKFYQKGDGVWVSYTSGVSPVDGSDSPVMFADYATNERLYATYNEDPSGDQLIADVDGTLYVDGTAMQVGDTILVKDQPAYDPVDESNQLYKNGVYIVTDIGSSNSPYILTRADYADESTELYPSQVNILKGTSENRFFLQKTVDPTIGISDIVYEINYVPATQTVVLPVIHVDTATTEPLPSCTYEDVFAPPVGGFYSSAPLTSYLTATVNGPLGVINGVNMSISFIGNRNRKILIKSQADPTQNGDYEVIQIGSSVQPWKLRRITTTYSSFDKNVREWKINNEDSTLYGNRYYMNYNPGIFGVIGSDYITFSELQAAIPSSLQDVTDIGNTTTNPLYSDTSFVVRPAYLSGNYVSALSVMGNGIQAGGTLILKEFSNGTGYDATISTLNLTDNRNLYFPDKTGTLAITDDLALKADLVAGKVPSSQLPSYVDDVVEGYYSGGVFYIDSGFVVPITGEVGKIYVDLLLNQSYRWSGSIYVQISNAISGLNDLTDVTVSTPLNGQLIQYNSTTSQWENQSITVGTGDMQKSTYDIDNDGVVDYSETIAITVRNPSTSNILRRGTIVYLNGSTGYRPNAYKAQANSEATSSGTFGVVVSDIGLNSDGLVAAIGTLHNLDTRTSAAGATYPFTSDTLVDGDALWLDPNTAGYVTKVKPSAPNHIVFVGTVARTHPTLGRIVYRIANGFELEELHNVSITTPLDNQVVTYEASTSLWKNKTISQGTPLTRQEFSYIGAQTFTLSATPSYIYAVFVNGQELNSSQYSFLTTTLTIVDSLESGDKVNIVYTSATSGILEYYTKAQIDAFNYEEKHVNFIEINDVSDLPASSGGVITLVAGYTYLFLKHIDLLGARLVCGQDTVIVGWSSENCSITSTGLSAATALITSSYSLPIRNISFTHDKVFDLQGDSVTTALDWFGVNLLNCASGGTIKNYTNFVAGDSALLNSGGFVYDGTIGTVAFSNTLFDTAPGTTAITILPTCTISRRIRIIYSSFVTLSGETGINFDSGATVGDERYILDTVNFSGGGTYISGLSYPSNKTIFSGCIGITNTSTRGFISMINNITYTSTANTALYYKAAGVTTASSLNSKFSTPSDNNLTYTGAFSQAFIIQVNCNVRTSVSTQNINIGIAKNGTFLTESEMTILCAAGSTPSFGATQCVVEMAANDYVELYVRNTSSSNNVMVSDMNFSITKIPV